MIRAEGAQWVVSGLKAMELVLLLVVGGSTFVLGKTCEFESSSVRHLHLPKLKMGAHGALFSFGFKGV